MIPAHLVGLQYAIWPILKGWLVVLECSREGTGQPDMTGRDD
jgi:hypothetical protein